MSIERTKQRSPQIVQDRDVRAPYWRLTSNTKLYNIFTKVKDFEEKTGKVLGLSHLVWSAGKNTGTKQSDAISSLNACRVLQILPGVTNLLSPSRLEYAACPRCTRPVHLTRYHRFARLSLLLVPTTTSYLNTFAASYSV